MGHVFLPILGLMVLMAVAVLMVPVANRLNLPHTVALAVVGGVIGVLALMFGDTKGLGIVGDFITAMRGFSITSEIIMFVFVPALVFESALQIDVRRLMEDLPSILFLAVIGLLISTAAVGYTMSWASGIGIVACLLLGAIVSATDPVAVVAIFKELGAPKRLGMLIEGESLFNDATAIVLFTILAAMLASGGEADLASGALDFVRVFLGGVIVGYIIARMFCLVFAQLRRMPLVEITLTINLAFLSFIIAEHYLHVSGVMAVMTSALVLGSYGRTAISPETWHALTETWEQIGFWFNSLIFVLVGMAVPGILLGIGPHEAWLIALLIGVGFAARAVIIYGLLPLMKIMRLAESVSISYQTVMVWGGLRGAVSLALALAVMENEAFDADTRTFISVMVTSFVLFTLFVNATTVGMVMRLFGLDALSPTDVAVRNRALALSLADISEQVLATAKVDQVDSDDHAANYATDVLEDYSQRLQQAQANLDMTEGISDEDWILIGLTTLTNQERLLYLDRFTAGYVSASLARLLLASADDDLDALKLDGVEGYRTMTQRLTGFSFPIRMALEAQRRFGWSRPLASRLADRFEILMVTQTVFRELLEKGLPRVAELMSADTAKRLESELQDRSAAIEQALDVLRLQYPDYARTLQTRHLGRVGLRLEDAGYTRMLKEAIISKEVHAALDRELQSRAAEFESRPPLDLELDPAALVAKVPFLASLSPERIAEIAGLLKPRLVIPGEKIVTKGDMGDAMYFVSTGAVEVPIEPAPVRLGSGEFFGEMALVTNQPRSTDVIALGYCQLLTLQRNDFNRVLDANPELKEIINRVAEERQAAHDQN
jgi:CPA1 family monovalent cation:H+ antiporter